MVIKRLFDIILSLTAIIVLFPFILLIGILVYMKLGSPILFTQERPGRKGKVFKMYKFRTMLNSKDKLGNLLTDEKRMTPFGKALRSTSLDELPELINVIKGDMSLVGPRPLLVNYLELYSDRQKKRHDVLPGITGWAQINGRNSVTWSQKFELDVWYVEHWSIWLDIKILLMTIEKVLIREGISPSGSATMEMFNGEN